MSDDELNKALADALTATLTVAELPSQDEQALVLQEIRTATTQPDTVEDNFDIVDEPAPKVGFVRRWTRKIVGWVKSVFGWRKD